jgi:hypothetical protein
LVYNYAANTITNTGRLCGMSADYANWLLTGGAENVSGNLYATFDFSNDLQAWTNLAVYRSEAIWGTNPPGVSLIDDDNGYYWDANRNRPILGVRQFTPNEVGGLDTLRNTNRELSWTGARACAGAWPTVSTGVPRWGVPITAWKNGRTWSTSRSRTTTSSARAWAPPPMARRSMR